MKLTTLQVLTLAAIHADEPAAASPWVTRRTVNSLVRHSMLATVKPEAADAVTIGGMCVALTGPGSEAAAWHLAGIKTTARRILQNLIHCALKNQSESMREHADLLDDSKLESRIVDEIDFHVDGFHSYARGEFGPFRTPAEESITYDLAQAHARAIYRKLVAETLDAPKPAPVDSDVATRTLAQATIARHELANNHRPPVRPFTRVMQVRELNREIAETGKVVGVGVEPAFFAADYLARAKALDEYEKLDTAHLVEVLSKPDVVAGWHRRFGRLNADDPNQVVPGLEMLAEAARVILEERAIHAFAGSVKFALARFGENSDPARSLGTRQLNVVCGLGEALNKLVGDLATAHHTTPAELVEPAMLAAQPRFALPAYECIRTFVAYRDNRFGRRFPMHVDALDPQLPIERLTDADALLRAAVDSFTAQRATLTRPYPTHNFGAFRPTSITEAIVDLVRPFGRFMLAACCPTVAAKHAEGLDKGVAMLDGSKKVDDAFVASLAGVVAALHVLGRDRTTARFAVAPESDPTNLDAAELDPNDFDTVGKAEAAIVALRAMDANSSTPWAVVIIPSQHDLPAVPVALSAMVPSHA